MTEERRILELAIIGLETERKRIEQELSDLRQRLGRTPTTPARQGATATTGRPRLAPNKGKTMSAAQKKKISQAMKARWAALRPTKAR